MALQLKMGIKTQSDCSEVVFSDLTGAYSVSNTGGWGTPNLNFADVDTAILSIENLTTSVIYDDINVTPTDDTTDEQVKQVTDFTVDGINQDLESLPDGVYCFTYRVTSTTDVVYEAQYTFLSLCTLSCKIKLLAKDVNLNCGCCRDDCAENIWKFLEAYTLYKALTFSGLCGSITEINKNITDLQNFLRNINCQNC